MKYVVKKEDEIVETKELLVNGEQNTVFIKENEYGDTITVNPNGYGSHRPFQILVNSLVLNFENGKLIVSRKIDDDGNQEFLIQNKETRAISWGADPHAQQFTSKSTATRRKIKGKNFKKGKPVALANLKTERYEVPDLESEHFMINYTH